MSTDSVMMHVRLNKKLKENAENIAEDFGLSLSGLVKVLLSGVVNTKEIPKEFLSHRKKYDDYLSEKVSASLSSNKISPEEAPKILGFDVEKLRKKPAMVG